VLPFKFQGILRHECITETDPDNRYWCSTKVNENLEHADSIGNWGYCSESCPPKNGMLRKAEILSIPGANQPTLSSTTTVKTTTAIEGVSYLETCMDYFALPGKSCEKLNKQFDHRN
jgi:hypothetical protein